ncbi:MAG: type II secretion system inner membrane protein GspF [Thiobacillaceae bacterium]|nr:type II secretion system inner membrane protein GspF [Thiobacillaceae bacterium]
MAGYRYEAIDATGRSVSGVLEADGPRQVRAQLRARGLVATRVEPAHVPSSPHRTLLRRGLKGGELARLTRQMASLTAAGLTVADTLTALIEQADTDAARRVLAAVRGDVLAGLSLAAALGRQPAVFSELYRALTAAGEETGRLAEVLERLADHLEASEALWRRVGLALLYPALLTLVALAVTAGLIAYVVPQVVAVFEQSHQRLPWLTVALIRVSDLLRTAGPWLIAAALGAGLLLPRLLRREALRQRWHAGLLRLPVAGRLLTTLETARFARTLAILTASGVPLLRALQAASGVLMLLPLRAAAEDIRTRVREGMSLARAIAASGRFPPVMVHLTASGERSGRLPEMLARAAEDQARTLDHRLMTLTALLEPALILLMGALVLTVVLAILLPIFEMNQLLR